MRGNTLGRGRRHRELYLFREARINEYCWNVKYNAGCRGEQVHDLEASKGLCVSCMEWRHPGAPGFGHVHLYEGRREVGKVA